MPKRHHIRKEDIQKPRVKEKGIIVQARTEGQKKYIIEIQNHTITFCTGPAGTGKTAISVGIGLQYVLALNSMYDKIVVMRPAKEACGEHIGFLPGDLEEKMGPWATPILDNMLIWLEASLIKRLFMEKKVEVIPLAYARGRSLNKSFIIVDEAQNCSPDQILMALTRIGNDSKMVVNGDLQQTDVGTSINGLEDAIERLEDMNSVSIVRLGDQDIVRNPIIGQIIKRYGK